jgi:tRNA 2-thiouridine synthesizing protein E
MPVTTIGGRDVSVDDEGFLTEYDQWNEELGAALASAIGIDMTDEHWAAIRFLRDDFKEQGETATLRRVSTVAGIPTKQLFVLFPKKPAKKMAYIAGLPKPVGCV